MAFHADHDAGTEIALFEVPPKVRPTMHFLRNKVMKSESNPALATSAGRD